MALIRSSLLSDISGSIGGTTYGRNRGGAYARNRTTPINPQTTFQNSVRSFFGLVASRFSDLTLQQINDWKVYALGFPATNRLGETYTPSAKQVYQILNMNLLLINQNIQSVVPPIVTVPVFNIDKIIVAAETDAGILDSLTIIDNAGEAVPQNATYQISFSPPQSASRGQSYRNQMRGANGFINTLDTSFNAFGAYNGRFAGGGGVSADVGQVIVVGVRLIDLTYGLASAWFYKTVEIVAV